MADRAAAVQFFNTGVTASNDRSSALNLPHAWNSFVSAVYADSSWWMAHYQCGNNAFDLKYFHVAAACQRRALECEHPQEERGKILSNLGMILYELGELEEAKQRSEEAVKCDPSLVSAWQNLSCIAGLQDRPTAAVAYARKAFEHSNGDERTLSEALLAFALLFNRQYAEGFKHFEIRFKWRLHQFQHYPYPEGRWEGQPDKTVFLMADQGLGDTLSFARFIPQACKKARYVHACVQPELIRLFQHAFVDVPNLNLIPMGSPFPAADMWTTMVSLPFALGLSDEEIKTWPHIRVPRVTLPNTWKVEDRKLHIGIAWAGSDLNDINRHRNIPAQQFFELYKAPGIQLYSMQVDAKRDELRNIGGAAVVQFLDGYIRDVVDTLALMQNLDLIITAESAVGHIAVLSGIECWVPYSAMGHDYRIGHGEDSEQLWSKHRIFKQQPGETWQPVFGRIIQALKEKVDGLAG